MRGISHQLLLNKDSMMKEDDFEEAMRQPESWNC